MDQKTKWLIIAKNLICVLAVLLAYILQETPALLAIKEVRPVLVISVVTLIAMFEGEFAGGLFGLFGGLLCDTAAAHIFGVASIFFLVLGCGCGLLVIYLIQPNEKTAFLLAGGFALVYGLVSHYLIYGLWGYEGAARLILVNTLPGALYTASSAALLLKPMKKFHDYFEEALEKR